MEGKRIKWGNVFIVVLIIAAAVAAFYYKDPGRFGFSFSGDKNETNAQARQKSADPAPGGNNSQNGGQGDAFILGLDSWIGGVPALTALDREYNRDYGLNLQIKYVPNDGDRIVELKEGKIHATEMSLPSFIRFLDKYPDAGVIVGITDFSRGADGIVAKSGVKDLNDMEGRSVSYVGDGTGKFILNKFLRLTGLRYQDIKPMERKEMSEVVGDLKSGKADLIVSWSPDMNIAVKEMNGAAPNAVKMLITTKEVPELVPTVLVVNKTVMEKYPDRVQGFLKTWYASAKYILERPDRAYERLAQLMLENKDVYGDITVGDVKESFANIKLMSLNDNFTYIDRNAKDKLLSNIMQDTVQTWKKYGDTQKESVNPEILSYTFMETLKKENDKELLVGAVAQGTSGSAAQAGDEKKEFAKQDETSIDTNTEKVAKIDIPPVYYDSGMATVRADSLDVLNQVMDILRQFPTYYLIVDAHTDSVGSDDSNLKLSKDRAAQVKSYLVSKGIDFNRIVDRGWGESKPVVAGEKTEEDRAKNRRTEFILTRDVE